MEKEGGSSLLGIEEEKGVGWLVIPRRLITSPSSRRPRKVMMRTGKGGKIYCNKFPRER